MNKLLIGEILIIFVFYILYRYNDYNTFFIETDLGRLFMVSTFLIYYYLDKYLGVLFCLMIVFLYYTKKQEPFFNYFSEGLKQDNLLDSSAAFRKTYCSGNKITYKGRKVKNEMIKHVFPEIEFASNTCNPCDKKCRFNIIEPEHGTAKDVLHVSTLI
jgi:hypothetical protein